MGGALLKFERFSCCLCMYECIICALIVLLDSAHRIMCACRRFCCCCAGFALFGWFVRTLSFNRYRLFHCVRIKTFSIAFERFYFSFRTFHHILDFSLFCTFNGMAHIYLYIEMETFCFCWSIDWLKCHHHYENNDQTHTYTHTHINEE